MGPFPSSCLTSSPPVLVVVVAIAVVFVAVIVLVPVQIPKGFDFRCPSFSKGWSLYSQVGYR